MKKLIIKIGKNMDEDVKKFFNRPDRRLLGTHTMYVKNAEQLYELLSPKRIELLMHAIDDSGNPTTVKDISEKTGRKQEAISRDASFLERNNLIEKIKKGRTAILKTKYKSVEISLAK